MSEHRRPAPQTGARNTQQRPGAPRRQPPRKRRRRRRVTARFVVFLVVMAILIVGCGALVSVLMNRDKTERVVATPTSGDGNALLSATDVPEEDIEAIDLENADAAMISELLGKQDAVIAGLTQDQMFQVDDLSVTPGLDSNWMNILLLGSDARNMEESSRTDTMIICSINTTTGKVKLTSILRDTAVEFDSIGKFNGTYRINSANFFGGPQLVMKTMNERLGMNIQYYAMVDFTSFSVIAEKLGGVEMDITEAEMEQINYNAIRQAKIAYRAGIDESELAATNVLLETYGDNVHLNGRQALAYARIRKIDSDFIRAQRQRKVLIALMDKLKEKNAQEIVSLAMSMFKYVNTNLSVDQIITVATNVISNGLGEVEQLRLPVDDSYVEDTRGGQAMLCDVNWETNAAKLYDFIYNN